MSILQDYMTKLGTQPDAPQDYWDGYELSSQPSIPLNPGLYILTVPPIPASMVEDGFKPGESKADKDGNTAFQYEMDFAKVVYPEAFAGRKVNFIKLSTRKSAYRQGSLAGDLLTFTGLADRKPTTKAAWAALMPELVGREFGVELDLRVWDKDAGKAVYNKGTEIPKNPDGSFRTRFVYLGGVLLPNGSDDEKKALDLKAAGGPGSTQVKVLYANNQIVRLVSPDDVRKLRAA